ncbi:MAG: sulfatase-like hydrolase/transferase [Acidobacteria bacterium]|nr:sulfatase-like hydrolase/transferase [Acidobacteriota bacterium]
MGALLMPAIAMVGVALPLGFISQVDGYLKYLQPMDLLPIYAWGWIIFGLVGLAMALTTTVPVMAGAWLLRHSPADWARRIGAWLSLSIIAISVLKDAKIWLEVNGYALGASMGQVKWELAYLVAGGSAVWIWYRRALPDGLRDLAIFGAIAGLAIMLMAVLWGSIARGISDVRPTTTELTSTLGQATRRPNIILLTVDALAADHMSLYGYGRATTPNLERLANQASVFDWFYANSNFTTSTIVSMMQGIRPWSHRALQSLASPNSDLGNDNLGRRLKNAGYQTMIVATNDHAAPHGYGATSWVDMIAYRRINYVFPFPDFFVRSRPAMSVLDLGILTAFSELLNSYYSTIRIKTIADHFDPEIALSTARSFVIRRDASVPFFLWVHLFPPHAPYATPPPFVGRFDHRPEARSWLDSSPLDNFQVRKDEHFPDRYVGRYDEAIAYMDYHVGQFMNWLKTHGLFDESLVAVTADHGESFVKGYGSHGGPMLHNALIHIPFLLKEPAQQVARRVNEPAEQIDLMPTILDLVGIPAEGKGEGRSLKPAMRGKPLPGAVFSMNFEQSGRDSGLSTGSVAMIEGRWKYVHYRGKISYPMMSKLEDSLYDLELDPGEEINRIPTHPEVATKILARIQEELRQHGGSVK